MNRDVFQAEIAKLLAAFPGRDAPEATIELWWQTFNCLPSRVFSEGVHKLILSRKITGAIPTVGEIAEACVGDHYRILPAHVRRRNAGVDEIMDAYRRKFEASKQLDFADREKKALSPSRKAEDMEAEIQRYKLRLAGLEGENQSLRGKVEFAEAQVKYLEEKLAEAEKGWREKRGSNLHKLGADMPEQ